MLVPEMNQCLEALGELDFNKRFLITSIIAEEKIGSSLSVFEIRAMENMPLETIEAKLHKRHEHAKFFLKGDSRNSSYEYTCTVHPDKRYTLKGPTPEPTKTHLQRAFGDDKILKFKFIPDPSNGADKSTPRPSELFRMMHEQGNLHKMFKAGILAGLRIYRFLVYKEDQDGSLRAYFIATKSLARNDRKDPHFERFCSVQQCRRFLMHIDTVSSLPLYAKRLQLVLSKTIQLDIDMYELNLQEINDISCTNDQGQIVHDASGKPLVHTDGCGFISVDLAKRCPPQVYRGQRRHEDSTDEEYPLLLQVRIFHQGMAVKGTLLAHKELPLNTIQYRGSMVKVRRDGKRPGITYNSVEICSTSSKPKEGRLSQYLVSLLARGGVPHNVFIDATKRAILKTLAAVHNRNAAYRLCTNLIDKNEKIDVAVRMLGSKIPLSDHFLQKCVKEAMQNELRSYMKAQIPIPCVYNLMGTADPTETLNPNQVAILLKDGPIYCNKVLVYKHPGIHPGDIRCFEATWNKDLQDAVGISSKYAIIFSVKGQRSAVDKIANSDLDGDIYWICTNEMITEHFRETGPWERPNDWEVAAPSARPSDVSEEELEDDLVKRFLLKSFRKSNPAGVSANSWLAHMDRYLSLATHEQKELHHLNSTMLELVNLNYEALDSEKTGKTVEVPSRLRSTGRPHCMVDKKKRDPSACNVYHSKSILGHIYDLADKLDEPEFTSGFAGLSEWSQNTLPPFYGYFWYGDYQAYIPEWRERFATYRRAMFSALSNSKSKEEKNEIIQSHKQDLYQAISFTSSTKSKKRLYAEASAIYVVVYEHARMLYENNRAGEISFYFAWNVAGVALCRLYLKNYLKEHGIHGDPYYFAADEIPPMLGILP